MGAQTQMNADNAPPPTPARRTFRVLIIDDNPADRDLLAMHLGKAWPFEHELAVEGCGEWPEVLEKLRTTRFAVIVLDWHMPGIEGAELLRRVREQGVRVPVVIVSGMERADIPDDLAALSAAFLNKDEMNADTLHAAIAESLRLLGMTKAE